MRLRPVLATLVLAGSGVTAAVAATATTALPAGAVSNELLFNGNAENGNTSPWTATGGPAAIAYGSANAGLSSFSPGSPTRGSYYFAGGNGPQSAIDQTVSLAPFASAIATGKVQVRLSAYLGGWERQTDKASVLMFVVRPSGSVAYSMVGGDPLARSGVSGLVRTLASVPLAPDTTKVVVRIQFARSEGTANDGYVDDISVRLANTGAVDPPVGAGPNASAELVKNGRFDASAGGTSGPVAAPNWSAGGAIAYGAPGGYPTTSDAVPTDHGANFWGGGAVPSALAEQVVSVSGQAAYIDRGRAVAQVSAYLGGYLTDEDYARIWVYAAPATGGFVQLGWYQGPGAFIRQNKTSLLQQISSFILPVGTRRLLVQVQCVRSSGVSCDGYVDDVSVKLPFLNALDVLSAAPTLLNRGSPTTVTFTGVGFKSGLTVVGEDADVRITNVQVVSATKFTATVTISPNPRNRSWNVKVTNPDLSKDTFCCLYVTG